MIKRVRDGIARQVAGTHARALAADDDGLTILAWALGAAFIVAPLAAALFAFSNDAALDAGTVADEAIG